MPCATSHIARHALAPQRGPTSRAALSGAIFNVSCLRILFACGHAHLCVRPTHTHDGCTADRPAAATTRRRRVPACAPNVPALPRPAPPQGSSGLSYSFSLFAPTLKELFGFSETQIGAVGSAMNMGAYLALPSGILFDRMEKHKRIGPKCVVVGRGWESWLPAAAAALHAWVAPRMYPPTPTALASGAWLTGLAWS